jgi:hypothetical protein
MSLSVLSVVGVAALGGGVAIGLSALVVVALACLVAVGLVNAIRVLGELLEAVDASGPTADEEASRLRDRG